MEIQHPKANEVLTRQNIALAEEISFCARPRMGELANSLLWYAGAARAGNIGAKEAIKHFFEALDDARAAASGIEVVRNGGAPPT